MTRTLCDRHALALHRARAARAGGDWFLHARVAAEIEERLGEVNKSFTDPVLVTGQPEAWAGRLPEWPRVADTPLLDLKEGAHDLVIHALSLHWADDPVGQIIQCRRALAPDGLFLAALFGGQTLASLRAALATAEAELAGGLSPRVLPMAEIRDLGGLLQRSGLALPVADAQAFPVRYRALSALVGDLRAMGETNALAARHRAFPPRALFSRAEALMRGTGAEHESFEVIFEVIFLTGWAPSPDQPRPLRPGSARSRLADALGVSETPAGEAVAPGSHSGKGPPDDAG
ncbi:MAG: SAM-dependent methyltransferase [Rhodobacteraceae bacterium]|nr:SAM-dependent methyltransferase [Paracoccaceae bacterium]